MCHQIFNQLISAIVEISTLLNTGLDADTLAICVRLCESGANPEALAKVIQDLQRESTALKVTDHPGFLIAKSSSTLDHRLLPPMFKSRCGHI